MSRPTYLLKIKERIAAEKPDAVFVPSDFFDIADSARVGICLRRIVESGALIRVMRGVYIKPDNNKYMAPGIAKAIARNYGWTIAPYGETALYEIGMSFKSPDEWTYISDGTFQTYNIGDIKLVFKHTAGKNELSGVHEQTALYIQALRAIGKTYITSDIIRNIAKRVSYADKPKLIYGTQRVAAWVRARLNEIYDESFKSQSSTDYNNQNSNNNNNQNKNTGQNNNRANKPISTFFGYGVGSKSESIIASSLHMAGLNFYYEKPFFREGKKPYKPDFTIHYKSRIFYWEHLGMLDNKSYAANWNEKLKWYNENIAPGQLLTNTEAEDIGAQIDRVIKATFNIDISQMLKIPKSQNDPNR